MDDHIVKIFEDLTIILIPLPSFSLECQLGIITLVERAHNHDIPPETKEKAKRFFREETSIETHSQPWWQSYQEPSLPLQAYPKSLFIKPVIYAKKVKQHRSNYQKRQLYGKTQRSYKKG